MDKMKVTLSIPKETNEKLAELAKENGTTKSGLVNFLVNQLANKPGGLYS
ncbi:protein repA [Streptococcus agalactiae]|nr:protein repA [Streptococcus agalactiae]MCC9884057.1 protein repA [Streptococcus agalactiae]